MDTPSDSPKKRIYTGSCPDTGARFFTDPDTGRKMVEYNLELPEWLIDRIVEWKRQFRSDPSITEEQAISEMITTAAQFLP